MTFVGRAFSGDDEAVALSYGADAVLEGGQLVHDRTQSTAVDTPERDVTHMTLRQRITTTVLISALSIGGMAVLPTAASAATPKPASSQSADPVSAEAAAAIDTFARFSVANNQPSFAAFGEQRDAIAVEVAARLMIDPVRLQQAWAKADTAHQLALMAGLSQLGVPYRRNTSKAGVGFDCSGFTMYAWSQAGLALFHNSRTQINGSAPRTRETAQAGDLVYYPGHVMMYLGVDDAIVHAPYTGRTVEVSYLPKHRHNSVRFADPTG